MNNFACCVLAAVLTACAQSPTRTESATQSSKATSPWAAPTSTVRWNEYACDLIARNQVGQFPALRTLAYLNLAMNNAIVAASEGREARRRGGGRGRHYPQLSCIRRTSGHQRATRDRNRGTWRERRLSTGLHGRRCHRPCGSRRSRGDGEVRSFGRAMDWHGTYRRRTNGRAARSRPRRRSVRSWDRCGRSS